MAYDVIQQRFDRGQLVVIDGATGTELERRGVPMDREAWSAVASLEQPDVLESIHTDYVRAGAQVITANTFSSSRPMLKRAGYHDRFEEVNRSAVDAALRARDRARSDVAVAGSISHWTEGYPGRPNPSDQELAATFSELASSLHDAGVDLILLEMMYVPRRIEIALEAAISTGLPVWLGLSARRAEDGQLLSFVSGQDLPFEEIARFATTPGVAAAGVMHTPRDQVSEALAKIRVCFKGPTYAYPESGYFEMPNWVFHDTVSPDVFAQYAGKWIEEGAGAVGGCCGLSPAHIEAIAALA